MKNINHTSTFTGLLFTALVLCSSSTFSQTPFPASAQQKPVLLLGGTVHTATGMVIADGAVAFDKGKLTYVGTAAGAPSDRSTMEVVDTRGKHIYPGFIVPSSRLGLIEVESIRATVDADEQGDYNPNVRSLVAYNADSEHIPAYRFNGILLAEATPAGGVISGTSSVMALDGWNWEDAVHTRDAAIHLNWPGLQRAKFDFETFTRTSEPNPDYGKLVDEIGSFFTDAANYAKLASKEVNLKMEAMQGLLAGTQTLVIHATASREIIDAVNFAKARKIARVAIAAGAEAIPVAALLKENNIAVIVPSIHSLPVTDDEDIDLPYSQAALLSKAGVKVAFSHTGSLGTGRNLPFYAGTSIAHGMDPEEALQALTKNPAIVLGIQGRVGTLEAGKDATLFVSEGDALDFRTNKLTAAFIDGKRLVLPGKHEDLYRRYSLKYGHMK